MKNCSNPFQLETFAAALIDGFKAELYLTPKPGLVDLLNNGSHPDLSLLTMSRSITLLRDYLWKLCDALVNDAPQTELIRIGQLAERRMLTELGTNCHRGGIFLSGLLLTASCQVEATDQRAFRQAIGTTAEEYFLRHAPHNTHGGQIRDRYRVGGIVAEARGGLPSVFDIALPVLLNNDLPQPLAGYLAMARLMCRVDDTTSLYRCGQRGLSLLRNAGKLVEQTMLGGHDPTPLLLKLDRQFTAMNLTMGGVADLLGVSFGYRSYLRQVGEF